MNIRSIKRYLEDKLPPYIVKRYKNYKNNKLISRFAGEGVVCSICGSKYREFAPFGNTKRKNARCLNCNSLERHRLLYKYLIDKTDLLSSSKNIKLLHFAPEEIFYSILTNSNVNYIPCDLFPEKFQYNEKVRIEKVDITNIQFDDNSMDVILCNHVFEHIPDDNRAMRELYRVMKKGGWGIFQVPIDYNREVTYEDFTITKPEEREKAFGLYDHVRWYGRDYPEKLRAVGFDVIEDDYVKSFSSEEIFTLGFDRTELIYFCTKS